VAAQILDASEKTIIYAGIGIRGSGQDVVDLSRKIKAPVAVTGINFDEFDANFEALLGSANRVATKPANEAFQMLRQSFLLVIIILLQKSLTFLKMSKTSSRLTSILLISVSVIIMMSRF
jgi:hypothetical protein